MPLKQRLPLQPSGLPVPVIELRQPFQPVEQVGDPGGAEAGFEAGVDLAAFRGHFIDDPQALRREAQHHAAAVGFAFAFHFAIDNPIQTRIRAWLKRRSARRGKAQPKLGPVISIDG